MKVRTVGLLMGMSAATPACGNDEGGDQSGGTGNGGTVQVPKTYSFPSRFAGGDSVNYAGQVGRQVLVADLTTYIESLTEAIDNGSFTPSKGATLAALNSYYDGGTTALSTERLVMSTTPPAQQQTYGEISSAKNLKGKIAGNDAGGQHKDWTVEFSGFSDQTLARYGGSISSPDGLVQAMFSTIDQNAVDHVNAVKRVGPTGEPLAVHQTENGIDLHELVQKFLLGAVNFSQATDDYLDDGLTSDNNAAEDGEPFTALEHGWDEGFGYFGAARDYADYADEEIAASRGRPSWSSGYHDSNGDGTIDLKSEYNFSVAAYAAKRDLGAVVPTDMTTDAFTAFVKGRAIINTAPGALSESQLADLKAQRDIIVLAWEKALSATVVHYINEVLVNMQSFGQSDYSFSEHAEHWSEMKGFALGLQFNPFSPLSDADFARFHQLVGDAPVLSTVESGQIEAYKQCLLDARAILQKAFAFDPANMGDNDGQNGW